MPINVGALDTNVYDKLRTFDDYRRAEQEFQLKKQIEAQNAALWQSGAKSPAALQLANEYQKRIAARDIVGANIIAQFAKTLDKGIAIDQNGTYQTLPGYAASVGSIEGAKAGYKQQAEKNVDLRMNPQIKQQENRAGAIGDAIGKAEGASEKKYIQAPQIETYLQEAEKLLPAATSGGAATFARDAAGFFGSATSGSGNDAQLDVIGAALTAGVPRMEGPQSNYDVALYQKAAGDLANSSKPRETRLKAIETIRNLNNKYMRQEPNIIDVFEPSESQPVQLKPDISKSDALDELRRRGKL